MSLLRRNSIFARVSIAGAALLAGGLLQGAPATFGVSDLYIVDTTSDANIAACTGLPNDCSLRGAINNANGTPGSSVIQFDLGPGYPEIDVGSTTSGSALATITQPLMIDGSTGGATKIQLNGIFTVGAVDGLHINAGLSNIQGLVIYNFDGDGIELESGGGNFISNNYIGVMPDGTTAAGNAEAGIRINGSASNTIGGTTVAARNVISGNDDGIQVIGDGNLVQGNLIGTDAAGSSSLGNRVGVLVLGSDNLIGGTTANARNLISGNNGHGVLLAGGGAGNLVQGNYIGTDVSGTVALLNNGNGVYIFDQGDIVGGTAAGAGNLISGNQLSGVRLLSDNNLVQGNLIGTDASGIAPLGNGLSGIRIDSSSNVVGGTDPGAANTIAFNSLRGIRILPLSFGIDNALLSNSIHSNTGLGIDIEPAGVNPNDPGDGDIGANNAQNFPVLTAAESGSTQVQGTFNSAPFTDFLIQFFRSSACDASGNGEGEEFLGSTNIVTGAAGDAIVDATLAAIAPVGDFITATATDPLGNTSEFSNCVAVTAGVTPTPKPSASPVPSGEPTATPTLAPGETLGPTPVPTPTPTPTPVEQLIQGDNDCDGDTDSVDALKGLQYVAAIDFSQEDACPALGADVASLFGDVDCDDDVDSVDALKILRKIAAFSFTQEEPCADIGQPL